MADFQAGAYLSDTAESFLRRGNTMLPARGYWSRADRLAHYQSAQELARSYNDRFISSGARAELDPEGVLRVSFSDGRSPIVEQFAKRFERWGLKGGKLSTLFEQALEHMR